MKPIYWNRWSLCDNPSLSDAQFDSLVDLLILYIRNFLQQPCRQIPIQTGPKRQARGCSVGSRQHSNRWRRPCPGDAGGLASRIACRHSAGRTTRQRRRADGKCLCQSVIALRALLTHHLSLFSVFQGLRRLEDDKGTGSVSLSIQIRLWKNDVQAARRVVALEHRVAKSETPLALLFSPFSRRLHKQQEHSGVLPNADVFPNLGSVAGRQEPPDIFEVADRQEWALPRLPFCHHRQVSSLHDPPGLHSPHRAQRRSAAITATFTLSEPSQAFRGGHCRHDGRISGGVEDQEAGPARSVNDRGKHQGNCQFCGWNVADL